MSTVAQSRRDAGESGYYVIDRRCDLAVDGPIISHHEAQEQAIDRNRSEPSAIANPFELRLVGPSLVPDF